MSALHDDASLAFSILVDVFCDGDCSERLLFEDACGCMVPKDAAWRDVIKINGLAGIQNEHETEKIYPFTILYNT